MALPDFNSQGDLPEGLHVATLAELLKRFGPGSEARREATATLGRIHQMGQRHWETGKIRSLWKLYYGQA